MKKFEYGWYYLDSFAPGDLNNLMDYLNDIGQDGWEVIQIEKGIVFLKREVK